MNFHWRFTLITALILILFINGCASIISGGSPSTLTIDTVPKDVKVTIMGGGTTQILHTPCTFIMDKKNDFVIILEYQGYESEQIIIGRTLNGWVWGNIILGGLIGLAIDGITGNMWDHNIHIIEREMRKIKETGQLPEQITVECPIRFIAEDGQEFVQYIPITFYKKI